MDWIPRSLRHKFRQMEEIIARLQVEYGPNVDDSILAKEMGVSLEELNKMLSDFSVFTVVSLEEKIEENSNFSVRSDRLDSSPEGSYLDREIKDILKQQIEILPEKERMIVNLYYYSELTYKEIAAILNISESRISQLHTKAMMRLKTSLEAVGGSH